MYSYPIHTHFHTQMFKRQTLCAFLSTNQRRAFCLLLNRCSVVCLAQKSAHKGSLMDGMAIRGTLLCPSSTILLNNNLLCSIARMWTLQSGCNNEYKHNKPPLLTFFSLLLAGWLLLFAFLVVMVVLATEKDNPDVHFA